MAKRSIELTNLGDQPWIGTFAVSNTLANAGVMLTAAKPTVTVPAKGTATVEVMLTIAPAKVQLLFDPTTPPEVKGGLRHIAHEASGQIWFHGESRSVHVPYHMLLRPVGDHRVEAMSVELPQSEGLATVALPIVGGNPLSAPLVSVFQFGYLSPSRGYANREQAARDLRVVGAASNAPELGGIDGATVFFGIAMDGPWIVPQSFLTNIGIDVDSNLDGETDYELTHGSSGDVLVTGDITERELADDAYHTIIDSFEFEKPKLGGILNVFPSAERETSLLNNSVMIYSAKAADLGSEPRAARRFNIGFTTSLRPRAGSGSTPPDRRCAPPTRHSGTRRITLRIRPRWSPLSTTHCRATGTTTTRCQGCFCCFTTMRRAHVSMS